jgi:hypothetical protein
MRNNFEGGMPPINPAETTQKKWERRVEAFRKTYPYISKSISYTERLEGANAGAGEIIDKTKTVGEAVTVVNTDTGMVFPKDRESVTEELYGCAGIFIDAPNCNEMVHMTPNGRLGYKYRNFSPEQQASMVAARVTKIISSLPPETPLDQCRGVIVVNLAEESFPDYNEYHYNKQYEMWERLKKMFEDLGLKNIKIVEVPMDKSALYHTPERPNEIMVMGARLGINPDGSFDKSKVTTIDEIWIPLDRKENSDYGIKRPIAKPS